MPGSGKLTIDDKSYNLPPEILAALIAAARDDQDIIPDTIPYTNWDDAEYGTDNKLLNYSEISGTIPVPPEHQENVRRWLVDWHRV